MMQRVAWLFLSALFLVVSCSRQSEQGYTRSVEGYSYKLLSIGDGTLSVGTEHMLLCDVVLKTIKDSVFFNSHYHAPSGFYIQPGNAPAASGKQHFLKLTEGDSLSLLVEKNCFFRAYFDTLVPYFLGQDSLVQMHVKIRQILQKDKLPAGQFASEDLELPELKQIDEYLQSHHPGIKANSQGLYILEHHHTNLEPVSTGKRLRISYNGFYLNGEPIDNGRQHLEFTFGTPDQLIKGLNIVIGSLKKGETTKIIVPSRLAFGESGSTNGSIPPYTPLLYNVTLIDIK